MASLEQMRRFTEEVVSTYVDRLKVLPKIIEEAYDLINSGRGEREKMETELRDLLAEAASLRRKDFDQIMAEVYGQRKRREEGIRNCLKQFVREQETLAERLKEELHNGSNFEVIRTIQASIENGANKTRQELVDFHNEEQMFTKRLKILVGRGPQLEVAEFKKAVKEMQGEITRIDAN